MFLLVATMGLAACGPDGERGSQPTTTTAAPTTTAPPAGPDRRPEQWVGIEESGRLVVVRSESGETDRVLGEFDHPDDCPPPGEPVAGCRWVTDVAVTPDGRDAYYATCCEPAPGTIYRVPLAGGQPEMVAHGSFPAIDPSGQRLAAIELQWVTVRRLTTADVMRFEPIDDAPRALHGMAWSPDGDRLAFAVFDLTDRPGSIHILEVTAARSLDDAHTIGPPIDGRSWTLPAFRGDGLLAVAEQELQLPEGPRGPARVLLVDPSSGAVAESFDPGAAVLSQRYDRSGQHLIYVNGDGAVRWRSSDGEDSVLSPQGYLAAAW